MPMPSFTKIDLHTMVTRGGHVRQLPIYRCCPSLPLLSRPLSLSLSLSLSHSLSQGHALPATAVGGRRDLPVAELVARDEIMYSLP